MNRVKYSLAMLFTPDTATYINHATKPFSLQFGATVRREWLTSNIRIYIKNYLSFQFRFSYREPNRVHENTNMYGSHSCYSYVQVLRQSFGVKIKLYLQEAVDAPTFLDNKLTHCGEPVSLTLQPLFTPERFLVLISVRG
jgi:hypothetical protein